MLVAGGLALLAVQLAPMLARKVVGSDRGGGEAPVARTASVTEVDRFVAETLPASGAGTRLDQRIDGEVQRATWQLPPGRDAAEVAEALREAARREGVEVHVVAQDLLDQRVRVYAGAELRHDLLLIPSLPPASSLPRPVNRRERPLVALIIRGLGATQAEAVVEAPIPLTIAVRPYTPYALPTARDAALHWQEVLVDLSDVDVPDAGAVRAAMEAVPHATGLVMGERGAGQAAGIAGAQVVVAPRPPTLVPEALEPRLLVPWQARDRRAEDLEARLHHLAQTQGHTTLMVDIDDVGLPGLMEWAGRANELGIRLVHASEALRPIDMIGMLDVDNPRAQ